MFDCRDTWREDAIRALGPGMASQELKAFSLMVRKPDASSLQPAIQLRQQHFALSLTHRHPVALGPVPALVEPHRAERKSQPPEIVGKARHQNDPAGNRSDCGAIDKFRQG